MDDAGSTPVARPDAVDLSRIAQTVARVFVSPELAHDAGPFTRLGAGRIRLDLLRRQSRHGERWFAFPHIAGILRNRMMGELQALDLPLATLTLAEIDAEIRYSTVPESPLPSPGVTAWAVPGPLIVAFIKLTAWVQAGDGKGQAELSGRVTWPESWGQKP